MAYMIWVTGACNLRCKYCYEGIDKPEIHMTQDVAHKAIEFIKQDYSGERELLVNFHGGEPFLRVDIMEYFIDSLNNLFCDKCATAFSVTTNATLLNEDIIDFIVHNKLDITVSLDGKAETHDSIRVFSNGEGSHKLALENALNLYERYPKIRVRMTYNSGTVDKLCENIEFLIKSGFRVIVPGLDVFDENWTEKHSVLLEKEIIKTKSLLKSYPDVRVSICEPINICGSGCAGGISSKHIYYNGDVYPCTMTCGKKDFLIGNIYSGIDDNKLKELLSHSKHDFYECSDCDLKMFCAGARCKMINMLINGDYQTPSEIECALTNIMYKENGYSIDI